MKRILSVLLAVAMLLTALVVVALPVSAAKGEWSVYAKKNQYDDEYTGVKGDVPGYEYTDEGFKIIPGEWKESTPYLTAQTTDMVNLRDGVYLQVRVDEFTYDAGDKWFGFSFWDSQNVELGYVNDYIGYGCETLIRIKNGAAAVEDDQSTWAGAMDHLEWYKDLEENKRVECTLNATELQKLYVNEFDEEKRPIITIEVKWDPDNEMLMAYVNDSPAPDDYNSALTSFFEDNGYMAYVGFSMQNSTMGGKSACTILKFGTSEEDASAPVGTDSADPYVFSNEKAELADSSTVEAGQPAIRLTGSFTDSHSAGKPTSTSGNTIIVKDDNSVNITANSQNYAHAAFTVENSFSYDIKDFPIALVAVRNLCTCEYEDEDYDGVKDAICKCGEKINAFILAGEVIAHNNAYTKRNEEHTLVAPYIDDEGNKYLYFIVDFSTFTTDAENPLAGRIHGIRIDILGQTMKGDDPARNNFDILEIAFYRTADEGVARFEELMDELGASDGIDGDGEDETDPPVEETTTTPEVPTTEETGDETTEETTEESNGGEEESTKAPATSGEKETNAPTGGKEEPKEGGCGGVVGVGAIAVVALAAMGLVSFRKKEEE